jgi:hypothetical protein
MDDLIEALIIFCKYLDGGNKNYPTECNNQLLIIRCETNNIIESDKTRLEQLGFYWSNKLGYWVSSRFG